MHLTNDKVYILKNILYFSYGCNISAGQPYSVICFIQKGMSTGYLTLVIDFLSVCSCDVTCVNSNEQEI